VEFNIGVGFYILYKDKFSPVLLFYNKKNSLKQGKFSLKQGKLSLKRGKLTKKQGEF